MAELDDLIADYNQLKQDRINLLERAGDYFGGVDERLDYLAPKIFEALVRSRHIEAALGSIGGIEAMPIITQQLPYAFTLAIAGAAGSGVRLTEFAPFSGYITDVFIHWPPGCNALVDVRVGHSLVQFCPHNDWLALDNVTPHYRFHEWVEDHEEAWVEMQNRDGFNTHAISVVIHFEGTL